MPTDSGPVSKDTDFDLDHFFYSSQDCICIAGIDGRFKKVNQALVRLLDFPEATLLATPYIDFVHSEDVERVKAEVTKLAAGIPSIFFEIRMIARGNSIKTLSWSCAPVGDLIFATGRDMSLLRKTEAELAASECRLQLTLEKAPVGIFITDLKGIITFSIGQMLDRSGDETPLKVGKSVLQLCEIGSEFARGFESSLEGVKNSSLLQLNGRFFEVSHNPVFDQDGSVKEIIHVGIDITEQRKLNDDKIAVQSKLIRDESEAKFRETFEYAGVGIFHTSFDGTIELVNEELCRALGYSKEELIGRSYFTLTSPEDAPTSFKDREDLFAGNIERIVRERILQKKNGAKFCTLASATVVRDSTGSPKYFVVAHQDITVRKEAEELLRASEGNFRILAEAIPQIVWTADAAGNIEFFNQKWFDYVGQCRELPESIGWERVIHPSDRESCFSQWQRAIELGQNYENERRFKRGSDGQYRWHLGRALPVRNAQGKIIKWFGTCTDIHDQKTAESKKNNLLIAKRVDEENTRLKAEFLATVSHEIRTPLNSVIGMSEILLDSPLDSDQYEFADTIKTSAEVLLALINDVLDLSKIEAERLILESIDFDLNRTIHEVEQELAWSANAKGVGLRLEIDPQLPDWVRGDAIRTRQILSNLLSNAIKFTHFGQVVLKVTLLDNNDLNPMIKFEVKDTGIGIAPADLRNLFQPFTQVDSSTTRKYGGTGLGLSICKRLVGLMKGDIGVTSELGKGSVFYFLLPFRRAEKREAKTEKYDLPEVAWQREPKILVAEDIKANQTVLTLFLRKMGCSPYVVSNGIEVLDALEKEAFDLILMDCQMPELDGYHTTKAIRSRNSRVYQDIPIVATTANAVVGERDRCLQAGMTAYLAKPIRFEDLRKCILKMLRGALGVGELSDSRPHSITNHSIQSIDWRVLDEINQLNNGDTTAARDIVMLFFENLDKRMAAIRLAISSQSMKLVQTEAHALKASASCIGALAVQQICERMRMECERQDLSRLSILFADLETELSQIRPRLINRFSQAS